MPVENLKEITPEVTCPVDWHWAIILTHTQDWNWIYFVHARDRNIQE
jgi:hypothetical protein